MDLLRALDKEWQSLPAERVTVDRYARWRLESAVLEPYPTVAALVDAVQERGDPERSDRLLAELARRSPDDPIAGRVLLQALMPAIRSIVVANHRRGEYNDVAASTVAVMWERIRTYPIRRRPQHIAANIVLDTRHRLRRVLQPAPPSLPFEEATGLTSSDETSVELIDALDAARRVVDEETIVLLLRTRCNGETLSAIAKSIGIRPNSLLERRRRAECQLRAAAKDAT